MNEEILWVREMLYEMAKGKYMEGEAAKELLQRIIDVILHWEGDQEL